MIENNHTTNSKTLNQINTKYTKRTNPNTLSRFTFLRTGMIQDSAYENALSITAKKWGISYTWVAGCIVSDKLSDSIQNYNNIVLVHIERKYGKEWYIDYYQEINHLLYKKQ